MAGKKFTYVELGDLYDLLEKGLAAQITDKKKRLLIAKYFNEYNIGTIFPAAIDQRVDEELAKRQLTRADFLPKDRRTSSRSGTGAGPSNPGEPPAAEAANVNAPTGSSSSSESRWEEDFEDEGEGEDDEDPKKKKERKYKKLREIEPDAVSEDEEPAQIANPTLDAAGNVVPGTEGAGWTAKNKRHLTWYLQPLGGRDDRFNERNPDGTLKALTTYPGFRTRAGAVIRSDDPIPDAYLTDEFIEAVDIITEVNGKPFFDPETNALGRLAKEEYLIIPIETEIPILSPAAVGTGLKVDQFSLPTVAAIYTLAKIQAKSLRMDKAKARRWAFLRMEAVKVGWFCNQPYVMRKKTPRNAIEILARDTVQYRDEVEAAHRICGFIPFLHEFCFRTFGSTYTVATSAEYVARADKFATSSREPIFSHYLDHDKLFGLCLRWVGIKRPMEVLKASVNAIKTVIPEVFQLRMRSAPSGQALITTSLAAIVSMESANWWEGIGIAGNFDTDKFTRTAEKILGEPWKYHALCQSYGYEALSGDEVKEIQEAKDLAIKMSPILQAYCDVIMMRSPLGQAKALRRHSDGHAALKTRARRLFVQASKLPIEDVNSLFQTQLFKAKKPKLGRKRRKSEALEELSSPPSA